MAVDTYAPGDLLRIEGSIRLYSPAITDTTGVEDISVQGWLALMMLYDPDGRPLAAQDYFMSTLLTPTGFPIQRTDRPVEWLEVGIYPYNLHYAGGNAVQGDFIVTGQLPADLLPGVYRPFISLDFSGVPTSTRWVAANVVYSTFYANEAPLPPIVVDDGPVGTSSFSRRLIWRLLTDDFVQGTRGAGAREDEGLFELASQIVTQGAAYYTPKADVRTGQSVTYRLEPFLPMISFTDRRMPTPPLIPFDLPGGELHVVVREPDGTVTNLGSGQFAQSFNRTKTTRSGNDLNSGTVQLDDVYSLMVDESQFRLSFDQYGHHVINMTGSVHDIWGNTYTGGGTYDVWVAHPLDIDPGVLPGTPLATGDAFNPTVQFYPRVPADVSLAVTLYPNSEPALATIWKLSGKANAYGYYSPADSITMTQPGEYRVDLTAIYTDTHEEVYMGSLTWGGVVMSSSPDLIAHGRRGLDSLPHIPSSDWFFLSDLPIPEGAISHSLNPYYNGDILWSRMSDGNVGGDSLILGASVRDPVGAIQAAGQARANRIHPPVSPPPAEGDLGERFTRNEIPLFISTVSGRPAQFVLGQIGRGAVPDDVDQIAYSYRSSQRPGVRVREVVAEDGQSGGYWRLDTLYDDQLGVGVQGDQVNDFKYQYVGAVFRDLDSGRNEYLGYGSGWIFIPDQDPRGGSRVFPPLGGYHAQDSRGGPILTLLGKDIHIFILPTAVRPGAVLEMGDVFRFAGHLMPTLKSRVVVTVTNPSRTEQHIVDGQANSVGYFYDPNDDFAVDEAGLWSVDVHVWHDGQIGDGTAVLCATTSNPCPSGDLLGSQDGRYWFYVVPKSSQRLGVSTPAPGFLDFEGEVSPITISGPVPLGWTGVVTLDYTISMPGYILEHGQVSTSANSYQIDFDPVALHGDFPNLDLVGRDDWEPSVADTFAIGLLLQGQSSQGKVYAANTITIQGEQVFVTQGQLDLYETVYLPVILRN